MFGPEFFPQVKYETWIGFGLQKPNANDDFWPLLNHNTVKKTWCLSIVIQFEKRSSVTGIVLQLK